MGDAGRPPLGARVVDRDGGRGTLFAVWAPHARRVGVIGDWNGWDGARDPMQARPDGSGVWERFVPGVADGARYKYEIEGPSGERLPLKADPQATAFEPEEPRTATMVTTLEHAWGDQAWMAERGRRATDAVPLSIYEVHLGSARRGPGNRLLHSP